METSVSLLERLAGAHRRRRPKKGVKTIRVRVPTRQVVNRRAIASMRELKGEARRKPKGEEE